MVGSSDGAEGACFRPASQWLCGRIPAKKQVKYSIRAERRSKEETTHASKSGKAFVARLVAEKRRATNTARHMWCSFDDG